MLNIQLKKFPEDAKEVPVNSIKKNGEISSHLEQVCSFYDSAQSHINTLPSFHIGYDYATQELIRLASRYFNFDGKHLLEIGCGLGSSLVYFPQYFRVTSFGIDLNSTQIRKCREKINSLGLNDKVKAEQLNALDIDSRIGNYDVVWSEDSFSHIPKRDLLLKKIHGILAKGGVLVFSDLVKTGKITNRELSAQQKAWCLWNIETNDSYLKMIHEAGYKLLSCRVNLGAILVKYHISYDMINGNYDPETYSIILNNNKKKLIKEWGEFNYDRRIERLKTYRYFEEGKLDYNFFVATKNQDSICSQ